MKPIHLKRLLACLLLPLAGGGLSILLAGGAGYYQTLRLPPLAPPGWLFPVVWTALYLLMGVAAYRISDPRQANRRAALRYYYGQLAVNLLWPIAFFRLHALVLSCALILALVALVAATLLEFRRLDRLAARLFIPYLVWTAFAAYLNLGIAVLN